MAFNLLVTPSALWLLLSPRQVGNWIRGWWQRYLQPFLFLEIGLFDWEPRVCNRSSHISIWWGHNQTLQVGLGDRRQFDWQFLTWLVPKGQEGFFGVAELGYDKFIVRAPKNNTSKNEELMKCPECQSTHVNKNGQKKGKQNYICVDCGRQFIDCYQPHKGYSEEAG